MSRIMQKEIKSEMNDFFFAKDHLDFYHEYVNVEQKYLAGIKEVRTKLEGKLQVSYCTSRKEIKRNLG